MAKAGNNLLPLRMGDAVRAQYLKDKAGVPYSKAVASIFAESPGLLFLGAIVLFFALFAASRKGDLLAGALCWGCLWRFWQHQGVGRGSRQVSQGRSAGGSRFRRAPPETAFPKPVQGSGSSLHHPFWMLTLAASYCGLRSCCLRSAVGSGILDRLRVLFHPGAVGPGFIGTYHAAMAGSLAVMGYDLAAYPAVPIAVHLLQFIPQTALG